MKISQLKNLYAFIAMILVFVPASYAQHLNDFLSNRLNKGHHQSLTKNIVSNVQTNIFQRGKNPACFQRQKTYGGSGDEYFAYVFKLHDGNYMLYGNTESGDGDFNENKGGDDAYLIKINPAGNVLWSKTYGGSDDDGFNQIVENRNGDIIAAGYTASNDGDVKGNHGARDGWLVVLDKKGKLKSQHCYGGSADDEFDGIVKYANKGFITVGIVSSTDGDESGVVYHGGEADGWVVSVNNKGNIVWQKSIGGSDFEQLTSIIEINNKFYVSGLTWSFDQDAIQNHSAPGHFDHFLAKFQANGDIAWTACHGGSGDEYCLLQSLVATAEGNLLNVGTTGSNDGDVSGRQNIFDAWVPKISSKTGALISQKCYGSATREQSFYSALPDKNGGFLLVGADASDFPISESWNAMAIKVDAKGNEIWKTTFGGSDQDVVDGVVATDDGRFLLACYSRSDDGDVTNQHGDGDIWMVKIGDCENNHFALSPVAIANKKPQGISLSVYPNPVSNSTTISFLIPDSKQVSIQVFNVEGRLIKTITNTHIQAGTHEFKWDAANEEGSKVAPGIYYLKLNTGNYSETKKLSVIK